MSLLHCEPGVKTVGVKRVFKPIRVIRHKPSRYSSSPEGLSEALEALEALQAAGDAQAVLVIPPAIRACLDAISMVRDRPRLLAVLPIEIADALVDEHAKKMRERCSKCADMLLAKYQQLENKRMGGRHISQTEDDCLTLLRCMRKSSRCLWIRLQTSGSV